MKKLFLRTAAICLVLCMLFSTNIYAADKAEENNKLFDISKAKEYGYCIIPDGTKSIPDGRYTDYDFDYLILNEGLESVGKEAFVNDYFLFIDLYIPASVKEIGEKAFGYGTDGRRSYLSTIYGYRGTGAERYANANGIKFVAVNCDDSTGETILTVDESISKSVTFGKIYDKVIVNPGAIVYEEAFEYAVVKDLVLNDDGSGKKITLCASAFYGIDVETLYVPSNIVFQSGGSYYGYQFSGCKNLKTVYVGCTVTQGMFAGCDSLKEVYFTPENTATTVDDRAFSSCEALEKVDFTRNSKNRITFGYYVFEFCYNLKEVIFDSNSEYYGDFSTIKELNSITVYGRPISWLLLDAISGLHVTVNLSRRFYAERYDEESHLVPYTVRSIYTISEVEYTPTNSSVNDYSFYVDGRALKIQVIEENGATRTFTRHASNVSITSYDDRDNVVSDLSADVAYERWTVHTRLTPDSNLQVRSKYGIDWSEYKYKFSVTTLYSDQTLKSADITPNSENRNAADCKIVTGSGVDKVRIEYEDGMTRTLNNSQAQFDAKSLTYTYNITLNPRYMGSNKYKVYIKTPDDGWKYVKTLSYNAS